MFPSDMDKGELDTPAQAGPRAQRGDPVFGQPEQRVRYFVAAFNSDCFSCGGDIYEGDEVGYIPSDGGASCPECLNGYDQTKEITV